MSVVIFCCRSASIDEKKNLRLFEKWIKQIDPVFFFIFCWKKRERKQTGKRKRNWLEKTKNQTRNGALLVWFFYNFFEFDGFLFFSWVWFCFYPHGLMSAWQGYTVLWWVSNSELSDLFLILYISVSIIQRLVMWGGTPFFE